LTAGYVAPRILLRESGIDPAKDLRGTFFLGSSGLPGIYFLPHRLLKNGSELLFHFLKKERKL